MSAKMEMTVGKLREELKDLPDETPVFVACNGECNYDFEKSRPCVGTDTFAIRKDRMLFLTDENAVLDKNGDGII